MTERLLTGRLMRLNDYIMTEQLKSERRMAEQVEFSLLLVAHHYDGYFLQEKGLLHEIFEVSFFLYK